MKRPTPGPLFWGRVLMALVLLATPGAARSETLWVVLVPGTSLADWRRADAPHLQQILSTGSVALMNTRTARTPSHTRETPESAALTLGAGSRAAGGPEAVEFLPLNAIVPGVGVTAGQLYARRMGLTPPPGSRVNVAWPRVLRENARQGYDLHPGNLADALHRAGVTMSAGGGPLAAAVATTGNGWLAPTPPGWEAGGPSAPRCVVWDAGGDLRAADRLLARLMPRLGRGRLVILSPSAGDAAYARGDRLCPVAVWGRGVPAGLLYSTSTRQAGLVTDTDFATTVAAYFGLGDDAFPVRPFGSAQAWRFLPTPHASADAAKLDAGALRQWAGMRVLPPFAVFLGLWMLGVTLLRRRRPVPIWTASVPPALILALLLSVSPLTLALGLGAAAASLFLARPVIYALGIGSALTVDMALGDPLMRHGLLGYSAIEGARYYGIGNEAMGALVGACLVGADAGWRLLPRTRRGILWPCLALVAALLGSPLAGAKAGGLLVALTAFGGYGWLRAGRRLTGKVVVIGGTGIGLFLIAVALLDARMNGSRASHLGQAAARLSAGGGGEWADIIRRKLMVEGHLLWHSAWAVPLWGGLLALSLLVRTVPEETRVLRSSGLLAVAACLAVNDAGAVAGSLCLALLWAALFASGEIAQSHRRTHLPASPHSSASRVPPALRVRQCGSGRMRRRAGGA